MFITLSGTGQGECPTQPNLLSNVVSASKLGRIESISISGSISNNPSSGGIICLSTKYALLILIFPFI